MKEMHHDDFLLALEAGQIRAAVNCNGEWQANTEVKQQILSIFRNSINALDNGFIDKAPFIKTRSFEIHDGVRIVPGGTSVRRGAYIGKNAIIMPPSYINIGAYIDDGTLVDSHVLVGSCAQIGKRVHLSAGVQIGGVLEPINSKPVIIEDDCFIGAGTLLTEGIVVRTGAVLAQGVSITGSVPIYDTVNKQLIKGEVPQDAVVIQGSRSITASSWGQNHGLSLGCAIIIKYKDSKTAASIALEEVLR